MNPDTTMKALSVPVRRELFELICERPRSVTELADLVPVSRPAVSQHLAVLVEAGLARATSVGTRNLYSASPDAASTLRAWLDEMWTAAFGTFGDFVTTESNKEKRNMSKTIEIDPVAKTLELGVTPEQAFDLFVGGMGRWWPLDTHSVSSDAAEDVRIDERVGGAIREVTRDGVEHEWGVITAYEPGSRFQFTWYPGLPVAAGTHVDVRFDATESGTRVTLVHSGWEVRGDDAKTIRNNYDSGWDLVLAPYAAIAAE
jgi:DNA-binding transcriptional ArsR family regulator